MMILNLAEAEKVIRQTLKSQRAIEDAAQKICLLENVSILILCGHLNNESFSYDYWTNGVEAFWLSSKSMDFRPGK